MRKTQNEDAGTAVSYLHLIFTHLQDVHEEAAHTIPHSALIHWSFFPEQVKHMRVFYSKAAITRFAAGIDVVVNNEQSSVRVLK